MSPPPKRGGARPGAGRKKGSGSGRRNPTASISMPPEAWAKLDRLRGAIPRSQWIAERVMRA
jgi:hypothetical protein